MTETHADFLHTLEAIIMDRRQTPQAESYTNQLLNDFPKATQKVGEEAAEVMVAALAQTSDRLIDESADLLYHLLVVLAARDVSLAQVLARLESRHSK